MKEKWSRNHLARTGCVRWSVRLVGSCGSKSLSEQRTLTRGNYHHRQHHHLFLRYRLHLLWPTPMPPANRTRVQGLVTQDTIQSSRRKNLRNSYGCCSMIARTPRHETQRRLRPGCDWHGQRRAHAHRERRLAMGIPSSLVRLAMCVLRPHTVELATFFKRFADVCLGYRISRLVGSRPMRTILAPPLSACRIRCAYRMS